MCDGEPPDPARSGRAPVAVAPGGPSPELEEARALEARALEAERYRVLWQRARDVVLFIAEDGRILDANDAALETYGFGRDELLAMNIGALRAPETQVDVPGQLTTALTRGALFETTHVRSDGARIPVEVGSRVTTLGGQRVLLSVIRDISERIEMQARLAQADRLASVGTLAAGVAHEINNPLSYAMTSVELALRYAREQTGETASARTVELLSTALHGMDRVRAIVRDLKMLARTDDDVSAVDVRTVLEACLDVAQHELRGARLVRSYPEVPRVLANEGRLAQVFLNLIVNAAQAVRDPVGAGSTVRIETLMGPDGTVAVRICDDGVGIAPEILPRVFDAFVTTKRAGEGTGLGLYLSRSIVLELGGTIEVESEPGQGAAFTVTLPVARDQRPASSTPPRAPCARRARILLVDDEIAIGRALGAALEAEHDLVVLTSGESALQWLGEDAAFDVVLTDVSMHGMSGIDLLTEIRKRHPALAARTVLMTGGAVPGDRVAALEDVPVLDKPFGVEALRARIARVLEHD